MYMLIREKGNVHLTRMFGHDQYLFSVDKNDVYYNRKTVITTDIKNRLKEDLLS